VLSIRSSNFSNLFSQIILSLSTSLHHNTNTHTRVCTTEYLKETVGDALTEAMAHVSRSNPSDPVEVLGRFLLKYADNKEEERNVAMLEAKYDADIENLHNEKISQDTKEGEKKTFVMEEEEEEQVEEKISAMDQLKTTNNITSILKDVLEHVRTISGATSVYLGRKEIGSVDTDEDNAEDGSEGRFVKYVCATDGDEIVLETYLTKGVTFDAWEIPEDEEESSKDDEEDGEEKGPPEPKPIHIPNVLRDQRIRFFRGIPRLGAFLAVPCKYSSCRNQASLDKLISGDQEGGEAKDENNDDGAEFASAGLSSNDKEIVLCLDTLSNNRPGAFSDEIVEKVKEIVKAIASAFERSDLEALRKDVVLIRSERQIDVNSTIESASADFTEKPEFEEEDSEENKRVAVADIDLKRTTSLLVAVSERFKKISQLLVTPKSETVRVIMAALHALGHSKKELRDYTKPSWNKISKDFSQGFSQRAESLDYKTCDLTLSKALIEGLDSEILKEQSVVSSLLLSWVKSLIEARDAWDAKVKLDEELEAERLRIEAEEAERLRIEAEEAEAKALDAAQEED